MDNTIPSPHFQHRKRVQFDSSVSAEEEQDESKRPLLPFTFEPGLLDYFAPPRPPPEPPDTSYHYPAAIRKARKVEISHNGTHQPHIQGDTGANVSATNDLTLLWNYRRLRKRINITTYDGNTSGNTCQAVGMGIIKIIANDTSIMQFKAYYIPHSTGTIISPDHYVRSNKNIKSFTHFGHEDKEIGGYIKFGDAAGNTAAQIDMIRTDGLWFTSNKILLNPSTQHTLQDDEITPTLRKIQISSVTASSEQASDFVQWRKAIHAVHCDIEHATIHSTQAYKDLELWHQRMGHISPRTMIETSKVVEGMPRFLSNTTHFSCPFCDKAKIRKQKGKNKTTRETFLPGTSFHMDLGFIHDSKVTGKGKSAKRQTLIKDRKGHKAYLLIICAATKYVWVFPLTSKHPPLDIINKFLDRHGTAHGRRTKIITTSPNGALASSTNFDTLLQARGLTKEERELDLDFETHPHSSQRYIIRTDNGGELAGSQKFQNLVADHGYTLETTAPGTSSLNGQAERPNKTLKERVRCLLYMAGLGVEFWADALLHVVWLYNRTYHTAIHRTPFEAYTGRRPLLDKLLTFGCRITAKKPGNGATALDPHCYDGIFLGYSATTGKVIYWDPTTQKEKTALTPNADEIHYGTAPENRPPAAQHLIEVITGSPHQHLSTHEMKEKPPECTADPTPIDHLTAEHIIGNSPLPYTAAAAKVEIPFNEKQLLTNLETLNISLNLFEPAISETIPLHGDHLTAGLILEQHPEYVDTVVLLKVLLLEQQHQSQSRIGAAEFVEASYA